LLFYEAVQYVSEVFCEAIAQRALPVLLYSGILQKFASQEEMAHARYRLNVLCAWEYGYFKSTLLERVATWLPSVTHLLTSSSAAAIRGSFVSERFYPPELLLADVMILPELTSVLRADDETIGALLVALEEATVRVALVKGGNLSTEEEDRARRYGARVEEGRLCYRNKAVVWAATHTIDNIPEMLRDAFLSRFYVVHLAADDLPADIAWRDPARVFDEGVEKKIAAWLEEKWRAARAPDHEFAARVLEVLRARLKQRLNPREVGDLRRIVLGHHCLCPEESVDDVALWCAKFVNKYAGLTTREIIAQYIYQNPKTLQEIVEFTGFKKANVLGHLKRMGASRIGYSPIRYYIDSVKKTDSLEHKEGR